MSKMVNAQKRINRYQRRKRRAIKKRARCCARVRKIIAFLIEYILQFAQGFRRLVHEFSRGLRTNPDSIRELPSSVEVAIERLNDDLLTQILLRLPPKLLLRSKCVSKRWLSVLSSPYLIDRHILRHASPAAATGKGDEVIAFCLEDNTFCPILDLGRSSTGGTSQVTRWIKAYGYIESLASV